MSLEGIPGDPGGLQVESVPLAGIDDGMRIRVAGRSTSASFRLLQTTIEGHLESGHKKLLLDCEGLIFLNSTALGFLINMSDRIEKERGAVGFIRVPPKVRTVFNLLGLQNFFPVFETEREAFAHFSKSGASRAPAPPPPPPPPPEPEAVAAPVLPRLEPVLLPVDLTKENLLLVLEKTTMPKRVRSEAAARKLVLDRLVKVFGKERVRRKNKDGGSPVHPVEVDLGGEFGLEIRLGRALLRPPQIQRFLGQLVANGKRYRREHVVAVIVGAVTRDQVPLLDEVRDLVKSLGMELVHLH